MDSNSKLPLGSIWEETIAFVRAETTVLAPLAFLGFGLPMVVLQLILPEPLVKDSQIVGGPWMAWTIPYALLSLLGTLSISILTLRPGISVREALGAALGRLPAAIGIVATGFGALCVLMVLLLVVANIEYALSGRIGAATVTAYLAGFAGIIWAFVRMLPMWAGLVDRRNGSLAAIRQSFALTRRRYLPLLALRIVAWFSQAIVVSVLYLPVAATFGLIGKVTGATEIMVLIGLLVGGAIVSAVVTIWTVFVARLYARLGAVSPVVRR